MRNMWLVTVASVAASTASLSGLTSCNKPSQGQSASAEIIRVGRTLIPTGLRYSDSNPTISDDGERITYISGRESAGVPILKAYKLTWSGNSQPSSSSRVTSDDIGYEREAVISPDGRWVVLASVKDNQVDVYLQAFDGSARAVKVTSTDSVETQLSFSPDSRLVAWLSTDATSGSTAVKIAQIGTGTESELNSGVDLPSNNSHIDQFFWLPTEIGAAKPYVLVTASASAEVSGASDLNKFQFATFGDIAGTSGANLLKGIRVMPSLRPALKASMAVLVEQIVDSAAQVPQRGTGAQSNPVIHAPLKSAPIFFDVAEAKVLGRFGYTSGASNPPPGFDVRSVALSSDSSEALVLSGVFYRCAGDSSDQFGTAFSWMKSNSSLPYSIFNPRIDLGAATDPNSIIKEAYTFAATDLCSNRQGADGRSGRIDDQIVSFALNGQATSSAYRVVYVTRSTTKLDSTCNVSAGDTEVWALNFEESAGTFYPISNNRDPEVTKGNTLVQGACRL